MRKGQKNIDRTASKLSDLTSSSLIMSVNWSLSGSASDLSSCIEYCSTYSSATPKSVIRCINDRINGKASDVALIKFDLRIEIWSNGIMHIGLAPVKDRFVDILAA